MAVAECLLILLHALLSVLLLLLLLLLLLVLVLEVVLLMLLLLLMLLQVFRRSLQWLRLLKFAQLIRPQRPIAIHWPFVLWLRVLL